MKCGVKLLSAYKLLAQQYLGRVAKSSSWRQLIASCRDLTNSGHHFHLNDQYSGSPGHGQVFGQQPAEKAKQHSGIIVNITAKVGSIGDNGFGGWYSYRMSKAALNMATRNLSIELGRSRPKVVCVCPYIQEQ